LQKKEMKVKFFKKVQIWKSYFPSRGKKWSQIS
jgi:hypothetical protein